MVILSCVAFVASGLWIAYRGRGTDMAAIGWILVVVGLVVLLANLYIAKRARDADGTGRAPSA